MVTAGYLLLAASVLAGATTAVLSKDLIRAAIALGVGGAALAMLFFLLDAPHAGSFELSVGAGLISILFIVAISLAQSLGRRSRES